MVGLGWRESSSKAFTILYTRDYSAIGRRLSTRELKTALDLEYSRLEQLFGSSLTLPVSIRVYPDAETYACLNANAAVLSPGALHSYTGTREIALIGNRILENYASWARNDMNFVRFELGGLFIRQLAGSHAPPGLIAAVGRYLQNPTQTIGMLQLHWSDWLSPKNDWLTLWDGSPQTSGLTRQLESASTVAFLVDTYGWDRFLEYLRRLPGSQNYSAVLSETYQTDLANLQDGWRAYYPGYFQGGWRTHLIYNYDLSTFYALLEQEKFAEAEARLLKGIDFLTQMQEAEKRDQAYTLLLRARRGQEAESLFGQSQQAFQAGDFTASLALLDQAEAKYAQAGAGFYHMDEIAAHRDKTAQAEALRTELYTLQGRAGRDWNTFRLAADVLTLGSRIGRLGDIDGFNQAREAARMVEMRQQAQFMIFAAVILGTIMTLLLLLARLARRTPPPEAQL